MERNINNSINSKKSNLNKITTPNNSKLNKTTKNNIINSNKANINKNINKINYSENRPLRSNGKYNLNFIDWNNEWERVSEVVLKIENGEVIEDKEEEKRIINCINQEKEKNGITVNNFEIVFKPDSNKECYICLKNFSIKRKVRRLFCKHMFCEECLLPWMKYNSKCPVCKFDFKINEKKEDENFDY